MADELDDGLLSFLNESSETVTTEFDVGLRGLERGNAELRKHLKQLEERSHLLDQLPAILRVFNAV